MVLECGEGFRHRNKGKLQKGWGRNKGPDVLTLVPSEYEEPSVLPLIPWTPGEGRLRGKWPCRLGCAVVGSFAAFAFYSPPSWYSRPPPLWLLSLSFFFSGRSWKRERSVHGHS